MIHRGIFLKIVIILFFYYPVFSQKNNEFIVENAGHFIGNFLKDSLNYQLLETLDCNQVPIKIMLLEFKFDSKQNFYEIDIKSDSSKKVTTVFAEVLRLSKGKWDKKFIKHHRDRLIFQPILYSVFCSTKKSDSNYNDGKELSISDKELSTEFQKQLRFALTNFVDLFGTQKKYREIKELIIFPLLVIDGRPAMHLKK